MHGEPGKAMGEIYRSAAISAIFHNRIEENAWQA
jgi:hypothetical protein